MWLLDTDHLSILERGGSTALSLQLRLGQIQARQLGTTIINYEEQMRGWMSRLAQARTPQKLVETYARLQQHVETFRDTHIAAYDEQAAREFERLNQLRLRIGTKDKRIAAICLAHGDTLLTRNLKDFQQIPGLRAEDWSA